MPKTNLWSLFIMTSFVNFSSLKMQHFVTFRKKINDNATKKLFFAAFRKEAIRKLEGNNVKSV